jgi:hypothetical protein
MTPAKPGIQAEQEQPRWHWALLAALVVGAVFLRAHDLARVFFWWDESDFFNESIYGNHPASLIHFALAAKNSTTNTWGWPAIVWVFCSALGRTLTVARIPSVLAGAAAVLAVFFLAYRLLADGFRGSRFYPALFAAALTAISMPQMEHSQRVYPYAGVTLMAAALLLAHLELLRALLERVAQPRLFRAAADYTLTGALALCIHPSLGLLLAESLALLAVVEARAFLQRPPALRRRMLPMAGAMSVVLLFSALLNRKQPKLGFRTYLQPYYHDFSLRSIPRLPMHAYDIAAYHLNLFYNPSLYWPEALNPAILPLICLCVLGWALASAGKLGAYARHFALLGLLAAAIPAALSMFGAFPFGGVRQTLFLCPFVFAFTALGFYALGGSRLTRLLGAAAAVAYMALWIFNLPRFYEDRLVSYRPEEIVKLWRENGKLPTYAWKAVGPLQYILRDYPEIHVQRPAEGAPQGMAPFFLISPNHQLDKDSGFEESLQRAGLKSILLAEKPTKHPESEQYPTCLYFPPNGFVVYKVLKQ